MEKNSRKSHIYESYGVLLFDLLVIVVSYILAMLLRFKSLKYFYFGSLHMNVCAIVLLLTLLYYAVAAPGENFIKRGLFVEFLAVFKQSVVLLATLAVILFAFQKGNDYSRFVGGAFIVINAVLTYLGHLLLKRVLHRHLRNKRNMTHILFVTENRNIAEMTRTILQKSDVSDFLDAIAVYDGEKLSPEERENLTMSVKEAIVSVRGGSVEKIELTMLFEREAWVETLRKLAMDEAFILLPDVARKETERLIEDLELMGMVCHYAVDYADMNAKIRRIGEYAGYTVVSYALSDYDYRRNALKRAFDIVGGLVGTLITGILFIFIAPAIKLDSEGPVFFKQTRIGKNGRRFTIYKFRSMCKNAEEMKKDLMDRNEADGGTFKIKEDCRVTKVGKFLRRTSLDEFPQFINILKGDMSLVGTRPPTEEEFLDYTPYQKRRMCMTPGLTGLWQVSGRSNIKKFADIVKLDLMYIDNWSWGLDIKILLKTIVVVITGKGAS